MRKYNDIRDLVDSSNDTPGIDIKKLKPGTKILVKTSYSEYDLTITEEEGTILAFGGEHIPSPTKVKFAGSTWGGRAIRCDWIGYNMHMEMYIGKRRLTTSSVKSAQVIGDGWEYTLDWSTPTYGA